MIRPYSPEEVAHIRASGDLLSRTLGVLAAAIQPGMNGYELDRLAETFIRDHGATPSFKNYHGFPATLCLSLNDDVVHGIPNGRAFQPGDIISVDCGVYLNGFHADMAYTFALKPVDSAVEKLLRITKESLDIGISKAVANSRVGDIGSAIQLYCEKAGFSIVRELVGHGVGKTIHEDPQVPNYGRQGSGVKLPAYTVIAIEPMVNLGRKEVYTKSDDWTVATRDGKVSAHFEHTVCVMPGKPDILTTFSYIEEAFAVHPNLLAI